MAFLDATFARYAMKKLLGLAHTTNAKDPGNEAEAVRNFIPASHIPTYNITTTPGAVASTILDCTNATAGLATSRLSLDLDASSSGDAYFVEVPSSHDLLNYTNPITGSAYQVGDRVSNIITKKFGTNWRPVLYDNVTEVPPAASNDWFLDETGVVTAETDLSLGSTGKLACYVYVGPTAANAFPTAAFTTIACPIGTNPVADSTTDTLTFANGANILVTGDSSTDTITIATTGVATTSFATIACPAGSNPAADSASDTLNLVAGAGITITGDTITDTVTIASTAANLAFTTIACTSGTNPSADTATDTLTLTAGSGITITGDSSTDTVTIAATGGGGGAVDDVTAADTTLTISPTTGSVLAAINLANANTWSGKQTVGDVTGADITEALTVGSKGSSDTVFTTIRHRTGRTSANGGVGFGSKQLWQLENGAGAQHEAAEMHILWTDPTDTSEDSEIQLWPITAGSLSKALTLSGTKAKSGQFESDVTTGTAPFIVASTTVVTNLNADLLDGSSASAFQPVDATLTSLAAVAGVQGDILYASGTDAWTRLAKDANATRYLSNTGSSNNPAWAQVNVANGVTGTLAIGNGGTGQTTATAAFNALDPLTTKGDIIVHDGTNSVRQAVGANGYNPIADSAQTNGLRWGDIHELVNSTAQRSVTSTPYTIVSTDVYLLVNTSSAKTLTLPAATTRRILVIKDVTGTANTNNITLDPAGSDTIEGLNVNKTLQTDWGAWTIMSDGTSAWYFI